LLVSAEKKFLQKIWENHERDEMASRRTIPPGTVDLFVLLTDPPSTLKVSEREDNGQYGTHN